MNFQSFLAENIVILDGGMGTMLQAKGLAMGEAPETAALDHPDWLLAEVRSDGGEEISVTL